MLSAAVIPALLTGIAVPTADAEPNLAAELQSAIFGLCVQALDSDGKTLDDELTLAETGFKAPPRTAQVALRELSGWKIVSSADLRLDYVSQELGGREICTVNSADTSEGSSERYRKAWLAVTATVGHPFDAEKAAAQGRWNTSILTFTDGDNGAEFGLLMSYKTANEDRPEKFNTTVANRDGS